MWTSIKFSAAEHTHTFLIWFIVNWLCYAVYIFFGNFKWIKIRKREGQRARACMCLYLCACVFFREWASETKRKQVAAPAKWDTHSIDVCECECGAFEILCAFCTQETKDQITTFICNLEGALRNLYAQIGHSAVTTNATTIEEKKNDEKKSRAWYQIFLL